MDVIALHQAGFGGAVAPLGTALTAEQMGALWQLSPEPVLCFDGDAAGARAAARAAELALPLLAPERTPAPRHPARRRGSRTRCSPRAAPRAMQAVLDGARPLSAALYDLLAEGRPSATPEQRAALRHRLEAAARADRRQGARRGVPARAAGPLLRLGAATERLAGWRLRHSAPPIDQPAHPPQSARATCSPSCCATRRCCPRSRSRSPASTSRRATAPALRAALLAWLARADVLDSALLLDQLAVSGAGEAVAWALRGPGLAEEARPEAQPAEALDGWWHFFAFLRGEAELAEDRAEAERSLVARQRSRRAAAADPPDPGPSRPARGRGGLNGAVRPRVMGVARRHGARDETERTDRSVPTVAEHHRIGQGGVAAPAVDSGARHGEQGRERHRHGRKPRRGGGGGAARHHDHGDQEADRPRQGAGLRHRRRAERRPALRTGLLRDDRGHHGDAERDRHQRGGERGGRGGAPTAPRPPARPRRARRTSPAATSTRRISAAPTTRSACTCARWARWSCSRARARSPSPSASRPGAT